METCDATNQQLEVLYSLIGGKDQLAFIKRYQKRNTRNLYDDTDSDTVRRAGHALRGLMHMQLLALSPEQLAKIIACGVPNRRGETIEMADDILSWTGGTTAAVGLEYLFDTDPGNLTRRITGEQLLQELAAATLIDVYIEACRHSEADNEATP